MRALVWIVEDTWEATVDEAAALLPRDAEIALLHVAGTEAETIARVARHGLLGRRHPPHEAAQQRLRAISDQAAHELLAAGEARLGRPARRQARRGRVEHEVVAVAERMDLLVLARAGDHRRAGPRSLGQAARLSSTTPHAACCSSGPTSRPR